MAGAQTNQRFKVLKSAEPTGTVIVMSFEDGREARYLQRRSQMRWSAMQMDLTETLCVASQAAARCELTLPLVVADGLFIWTKHPEASRLGQEVMYLPGAGQPKQHLVEQQGVHFVSIEEQQRLGSRTLAGLKGRLSCDKFEWLTNVPNVPGRVLPTALSVASWSGETNTSTLETNVAENQAVNGGFDVQLSILNGNTYQIDNATYYTAFAGSPALVSQGPATLVTHDKQGELCQTTFNMSLGKTTQIINELREEIKNVTPVQGPFPIDILTRIEFSMKGIATNAESATFAGAFE